MRAEGKELLLAGFFSFLTAVLIGIFWAGGDLAAPDLSARPGHHPRLETDLTAHRFSAGKSSSYRADNFTDQNRGFQDTPTLQSPGWSAWAQAPSWWTSSSPYSPGIPDRSHAITHSSAGSLADELTERPLSPPYAANPLDAFTVKAEEERNPSPSGTATLAPSAGGYPLITEPLPSLPAVSAGDLSPADSSGDRGGETAALPTPSDGTVQRLPAVIFAQIPEITPVEEDRISPVGEETANPSQEETIKPSQSDDKENLPAPESQSATDQPQGESTTGNPASDTQPEGVTSPHIPQAPPAAPSTSECHRACVLPAQPVRCRCGCFPRCRAICIPRPGWIPPCGLLYHLRQLLQCPQGSPLTQALTDRVAELAGALEALARQPSNWGGSASRFRVEQIPNVAGGSENPFAQTAARGGDAYFFPVGESLGDTPWDDSPTARLAGIPTPPVGLDSRTARERAAEAIAQLERMRAELLQQAESTPDARQATLLRRTAHAISRRLPLWNEIAQGRPQAAELLEAIEQYEQTNLPRDGARVASLLQARALKAGEDDVQRQLEHFFRNSNLRWEVSENLLNRWIKPQPVRAFRIRDYILGRPVVGESQTISQVRFALIPDPHRLMCRLIITGQVTSNTQSLAGPATFFDRAYGSFTGWKDIELTEDGLRISPPLVRAHQRVELRGLRTDFDGIPLIGALAHEIALSQRERSMPEAQAEARQKLIARITQQFEAEAAPRLAKLEELVEKRLLRPAKRLGLEPRLLQASTREDRLIARWRLAAYDQLGAHTPRPRIPEGAVAAFQIHQSAVNNILARLQLAGRTLTPTELQAQMAELLDSPELADDGSARDDVLISFAPVDPVYVQFQEGKVTIVLSVARLENKPHVWENFLVRVSYRPENVNGETVFVRDGVVSLSGESLSLKDQLALRGIFSKRFSKERTWPVLPKLFRENPDFADLRISHLMVEDGWFSWAVSSSPTGPSTPTAPPSPRIACF